MVPGTASTPSLMAATTQRWVGVGVARNGGGMGWRCFLDLQVWPTMYVMVSCIKFVTHEEWSSNNQSVTLNAKSFCNQIL